MVAVEYKILANTEENVNTSVVKHHRNHTQKKGFSPYLSICFVLSDHDTKYIVYILAD